MPDITKEVKVAVEMKARRVAYAIEAQGISLRKRSDKYEGKRKIKFDDDQVNIRITFKGQKGQEYEVKTTINSVTKTIDGELEKDGINHASGDYPRLDFNF